MISVVAFVTFEKMDSADEAIQQMNNSMVSEIQLKVSMARRQPTFEHVTDTSNSSWSSIGKDSSCFNSLPCKYPVQGI